MVNINLKKFGKRFLLDLKKDWIFYKSLKFLNPKFLEIIPFLILIIVIGLSLNSLIDSLKIILPSNFNMWSLTPLIGFIVSFALIALSLFYFTFIKKASSGQTFDIIGVLAPLIIVFPISTIAKIIMISIFILLIIPETDFSKFEIKWPIFITIAVIIFFLIVSFGFIALTYGNSPTTYPLYNCSSNSINEFNMNCSNILSQEFIAGYQTSCTLNGNLTNLSSQVSFEFSNGSWTNQTTPQDNVNFIPPLNSERILFYIYGIDTNDSNRCMNVQVTKHVLSYEEFAQNRTTFNVYFISILGIAFFVIPLGIKQFLDLINYKKE